MASVLTTIKNKHIVTLIDQGGVGILPTDTLYGIVCSAINKQAVSRLYGLKKREQKPGTIIAGSIDQLVDLGLKRRYLNAVAGYWPGPISVIVPTDNQSLAYLDQNKGTLAVRVVADKELRELLNKTGPLLTSSANQPGELPAATIAQADKYFGDTVDFYVDEGKMSGKPSTIIRVVDDAIEILRPGAGSVLG